MLVDDEPVCQDVLKRRRAGGPDGRQDRRLKPAAVLVRAFQVHECGEAQAEILAEDGAMARAGLEPDVEDVTLLSERCSAALRARRSRGQQFFDGKGKPGVGPFRAKQVSKVPHGSGREQLGLA